MKSLSHLVFVAMILSASTTVSDGRVFRNKEGREISGEIVMVRGEQVEMNVGGRLFSFPIANLGENDQQFVREWAAKNRTFKIDFTTRAVEDPAARRTQGEKKDQTVTRSWRYETTLTNRSGADLEGLEIKYNVIVRHTDDATTPSNRSSRQLRHLAEIVVGSAIIPGIANSASAAFETDWLFMESRDWEISGTGVTRTGSLVAHSEDFSNQMQLDGIWVKVFQEGRQIGEWKSDGKLIKEVEWSDTDKEAHRVEPLPDPNSILHRDLPRFPEIPESKKDDPEVKHLRMDLLSMNAKYRIEDERAEKKDDLRRIKAEFIETLERLNIAIGNAP